MREVSRRRYRWVRSSEKERVEGWLPPFSRSLGLDVIISEADELVLVELQHGFGRRGLITLFPQASRCYRKTYWRYRRECGRNLFVAEQLRKICGDKIQTYRHFGHHQPRSFVFQRWGEAVEAWLDSLGADHVLAKPPRGSCGAGIQVFDRRTLRLSGGSLALGTPPLLLQEFVRSRPLVDEEGRGHLGCIRHILLLRSDGESLSTVHLPSYWRVSPAPITPAMDPDALIANISRGAYAEAVEDRDGARIRDLADQLAGELVREIFKLDQLSHTTSLTISRAGEMTTVSSLPRRW